MSSAGTARRSRVKQSNLRRASGAAGVPAWLRYGPAWSYRALPSFVSITGGGTVDAWVDELAPSSAARTLTQASVPDQPTWVASSAAPSGRPAVQGDGVAAHLASTTAVPAGLLSVGPVTSYMLCRVGAPSGNQTQVGAGDSGTADRVRHWYRGAGDADVQHGSSFTTGGVSVANSTYWQEVTYDGVTCETRDSAGGVGSVAAGPQACDTTAVLARISGGSPIQPAGTDVQLLWWLGYASVLPSGARAEIQADLAAWGSI